jgi:hypothetical protein
MKTKRIPMIDWMSDQNESGVKPGFPYRTWGRMPQRPDPHAPNEAHYDRAAKVMEDPDKRAAFETLARKSGRSLFALVLADVMEEPEVESIYLADDGGKIGIQVNKPSLVVVQVTMFGPGHQLLQRGRARRRRPCFWQFRIQNPVPSEKLESIEVGVADLAGYGFLETLPMAPSFGIEIRPVEPAVETVQESTDGTSPIAQSEVPADHLNIGASDHPDASCGCAIEVRPVEPAAEPVPDGQMNRCSDGQMKEPGPEQMNGCSDGPRLGAVETSEQPEAKREEPNSRVPDSPLPPSQCAVEDSGSPNVVEHRASESGQSPG